MGIVTYVEQSVPLLRHRLRGTSLSTPTVSEPVQTTHSKAYAAPQQCPIVNPMRAKLLRTAERSAQSGGPGLLNIYGVPRIANFNDGLCAASALQT